MAWYSTCMASANAARYSSADRNIDFRNRVQVRRRNRGEKSLLGSDALERGFEVLDIGAQFILSDIGNRAAANPALGRTVRLATMADELPASMTFMSS